MRRGLLLVIIFVVIGSGCHTSTRGIPTSASDLTSSPAHIRRPTLIATPETPSLATTTHTLNTPETLTVLPADDLVAFVGILDKTQSIAIITSTGRDIHFLTDAEGEDHNPEWSPDGKKIAFLSNRAISNKSDYRDLWIVDIATQQLTQLTNGGKLHKFSSFTWSPDATQIAYSQAEGPVSVVRIADKVSRPLGEQFHAPLDWSPNGQWIATEEAIEIDPNTTIPGRFLAIVDFRGNIIDGDKHSLNTVTSLSWSPNGQHLAIGEFFSSRGEGDLTVLKVQEGRSVSETSLAENFGLVQKESVNDVSWSPDSTKITFRLTTTELLAKRLSNFGYIYITDFELNSVVIITPEDLLCNKPNWSADGSKIIFACKGRGDINDSDIWMINRDGSGLEQLASSLSYEGEPVWQPK